MSEPTVTSSLKTNLGTLYLAASEKGLTQVSFKKAEIPKVTKSHSKASFKIIKDSEKLLKEYFETKKVNLKSLKLDTSGTELQEKTWKVLREIPSGKTLSYSEVAKKTGKPKAVRAVASACGKNPLLVVTPCHRVLRSDGSLGGFRGGLSKKRELLALESID